MAVGAIELYVRNEDGELVAATLAGVDATLAGLSDVNITDPQDGDVLSYDTDEWVNTAAESSDPRDDISRVYNGCFESALIGVEGWTTDEPGTLTRETSSPITGTGSMRQEITDDFNGFGPYQDILGTLGASDWGDTWQLTWKYQKQSGADTPIIVFLDYFGAANVDEAWSGTATSSVQDGSVDIVLPANGTRLTIAFYTAWSGIIAPAVLLFDDIRLVKIANAA